MPTRLPQLFKTMATSNRWNVRAWLRSPTVLLMTAGLILPNILTLATLGSFIDVSLPPRTMCIPAYAVLAICARRIPFVLTAILFLGILIFDLIWTLSVSFGLRPHDLLTAVDYAQHIHVFESPLYGALIAVLATTTIATLYLLYRRDKLIHGNIVALFVASLVFAGADYFANVSPHYEFGAMLGRNVPIESAANKSGFNQVAGADGRNAILVMVEGLGYLNDSAARHQIDAPLFDPRVTDKYRISTGSIVYYGSTTSGEMRELCDTREPYLEFTKANGFSCLPERLRMRGYATMAVHGFYHSVFERDEWYPIIGFDKEVFVESLVKVTSRLCGNAFRGVCDADLPPIIAHEASFSMKPKFIYWLTLNTHIPVSPGEALVSFGCERNAGVFQHARVCDMAELWRDVFAAVSQLALDRNIGPANILVVGDHAPPLWSRKARSQFKPGLVPWYRLTPRESVLAATPARKASATR